VSIVAAIENQERLATGYGSLQEERLDALDRYLGRPYGDEQEGRSAVVMRDVHDTVEWIKPSLMKVFASGDEVCKFNPTGPEDEEQAQQETDYVNHVLMEKNNGFLILHDLFHDALLQKNGYGMVCYEEEKRASREPFKSLTDDEFALIAGNPEVEIVEHGAYLDEMGMPRHNAVIRAMRTYGCVRVKNIPPERVLIASDWPHMNLQGCPFVEVIDYETISSLRQQGYEVEDTVDDTSSYSDDKWEEQRRDAMFDGSIDRDDIEADPATRRVRVRRVWMLFDEDGDGIAELRRIVIVGTTVLENEEDDLTPVFAITPQRMPHEHYGISVADNVSDLQRIRTVLVRGFLDNMYLANNGRNAVDQTRVNLDDMMVSRPGGVVRVQGDPSSAIFPIQHVQQGPAILSAIEYVDSVRENRTGVTKYNQGLDANSLNKTASGVTQIMTAAQQRIELIARIFAETGVKALMSLIHAVSMKHTRQAEMIKLRNKWVQVDPRTWKERRDLTVSVGLGTGNKDQMLQHLMMILQIQREGIQMGIASPENVYNAAVKLTQNAGFKMPEEFWSNPRENPPQQQEPPEVTKEKMKLEADAQKFQAQTQIDREKLTAEAELERERMQMQTQIDANRQQYEAQQQREKLALESQIELMRQEHAERMAAAQLAFDRWKAELDASTQMQAAEMSQPTIDEEGIRTGVMDEVKAMLNAPPTIVRDDNGMAIAVERGGITRKIKRDERGRPVSLE
jgi:hypothetical protein